MVYALKKSVGSELISAAAADLRLNLEAVNVDATMFWEAMRAGDLERAVGLYTQPFCDGFSIPAAPEFERWIESRRQAYAAAAASALRQLIEKAKRENAVEREVEWCRRLVLMDPHDSRAVVTLMDALEKAGDLASAVGVAKSHERLMRDDLDLPVSEAVAGRLLRLTSVKPSAPAPKPKVRTTPDAPSASVHAEATAAPRSIPRWQSRMARKAAGLTLLLGGLAVSAILVANRISDPVVAAALPVRRDVVAVLPFDVNGVDSDLKFLGEGAANLLVGWLRVSDRPRAVDPGTVLAILDTLKKPAATATWTTLDRAQLVGRKASAGEVIVGKITGSSKLISIVASIHDVETGDERGTTQVAGSADQIADLMETVATRLVAQAVVGPDRANAFADARFAVLRAHLRAEAAFHDDNYKSAIALYEKALALDSGFAPAALGLAMAADRLSAADQHERGLALAWASRDRLGESDRLYLEALAGPRYPEPSAVRDVLAAWERVVELNPDRATAWTELGERFLFDGRFLGIRDGNSRAAAAFRKSLELDSENPRAVRGLLRAAASRNDVAEIRALLSRYDLADVGGELTGYLRWRIAIAQEDTSALRRLRARFQSMNEPSLRAVAMSSQHELVALDDGRRAVEILARRSILASDRLDALLARHSLFVNAGDAASALAETEKIDDVLPGSRAHLRLRVLDALYSEGDTAAAERAIASLERARSVRLPTDGGDPESVADLCVIAQWHAAPWGRTGSTRRGSQATTMIRELRQAGASVGRIPVAASPRACAAIVDAMLAVKLRSRSARGKVEALDEQIHAGAARDGMAWVTVATARLYGATGQPERALTIVQQRPYMKGWPRYLAASLKDEAMYAERAGDADAARRARSSLELLSRLN